ncbi:MAG: cupin domain-containing protein [Polyangiaceae bacterium]
MAKVVLHETAPGATDDPRETLFRRGFLARSPVASTLRPEARSPLAGLLAPLGPKRFFGEYFGQRFHHFRAKDRERFAKLFSFDTLGSLIANRHIPIDYAKVFDKRGSPISSKRFAHDKVTGTTIDPEKLMRLLFVERASMSVKMLSLYDPGCAALAAQFTEWLHHDVTVNAYFTLRDCRTSGWHWDPYDIFVLQVEGRKNWDIYEPLFDYAMSDTIPDKWKVSDLKTARKLATLTLERGDVLYLPAGTPHDPMSPPDQDSLHLSVGVASDRWHDIVSTVVDRVLSAMRQDPEFRRPAWGLHGAERPPARDEATYRALLGRVAKAVRETPLEVAVRERRRSRASLSPSEVQDAFRSHLAADRIDDSTPLVRTALPLEVARTEDFYELRLPRAVVCVAKVGAKALTFVQSRPRFTVGDLPGLRTTEARVELASALLRADAVVIER